MPLKELCRICNIEKDACMFGIDRARYDGLMYLCLACRKKYREANSEVIKAAKREHYNANRERLLEEKRKAYQNEAERKREYQREYYALNKNQVLERNKNFHKENPDYYKQFRKRFPGKVNAKETSRKTAKLQRTPEWLTPDDHWMIEQAYDLAAFRTAMFGFAWHVDHIIPLQGKNVSGLHVPSNLQVIPALVNIAKNNHFKV